MREKPSCKKFCDPAPLKYTDEVVACRNCEFRWKARKCNNCHRPTPRCTLFCRSCTIVFHLRLKMTPIPKPEHPCRDCGKTITYKGGRCTPCTRNSYRRASFLT